jgi:hypothetical protein
MRTSGVRASSINPLGNAERLDCSFGAKATVAHGREREGASSPAAEPAPERQARLTAARRFSRAAAYRKLFERPNRALWSAAHVHTDVT